MLVIWDDKRWLASGKNTWSTITPVDLVEPPVRSGHTATLTSGNLMVVFGGTDGTNYLNDVWVFHLGMICLQLMIFRTQKMDLAPSNCNCIGSSRTGLHGIWKICGSPNLNRVQLWHWITSWSFLGDKMTIIWMICSPMMVYLKVEKSIW